MARNSRSAYGFGIGGPIPSLAPTSIVATRDPTTNDLNYELTTLWVNTSSNQIWHLTSVSAGSATWALSSPGNSDVDTITGDGGGAISPTAGDMVLAGGTNLTTAGTAGPGTITFNLDNAITLSTSVTSPIYTSAAGMAITSAAANDITIKMGDAAGAQKISFTDSADAEQASLDSDGTATFVNMDGIIGATTPAAITATTVSSPIFTTTGAVDTNINVVAGQDLILKMGDAAGANKISLADSTGAEVASIDSNGAFVMGALTFSGLLTANASATINTAGTALSLGTDNSGDAVNIGTGNVIRAIGIGNAGAVAHTVAIGSASGGAMSIDTAAGISLDSATASNFTVTGAADLAIASTTGGVNITSGEAATSTGITIDATAADGGVTVDAGTGGLLAVISADCTVISLGDVAPTASRTTTIGGGTVATAAVTDTIDIGPDGATTNANSIKTVNINTGTVATGQLNTNIASGTVTSGNHTVNLATGNRAAGTMIANIGTGTGIQAFNIGNADGLTTFAMLGNVDFNLNQNNTFTANTGTSTGTVDIGNVANSGAMTLGSSSTIDIDSAGILSLNSSGGVINIGDDAIAQNMNFGTGGDRDIVIGNNAGANRLTLSGGTSDMIIAPTVRSIAAKILTRTGDSITLQASPVAQSFLTTGAAPTGAGGDVNILMLQEGIMMEQFIIGTQTIIAPRMVSNGLSIALDQTNTDGVEYNFGAPRTNSRHSFTIGTSAAFYFQVTLGVDDLSAGNPFMIGFRRTGANNATMANYTDYAALGINSVTSATNVSILTELNGTGQTATDSGDLWTGGDGGRVTLRVNVSAAGVTTFEIDGVAATAAPAFTFDGTDVVCPYVHLIQGADLSPVYLVDFAVGFQDV